MIRGSELAAGLPDDAVARSAAMLAQVRAGNALELFWAPVISSLNDGATPRWVATFHVTTDALQLGIAGDSFRPTFTDRDQIEIANLLGVSRTTAKLADLSYLQAPIKLTPHTHSATKAEVAVMGTRRVMLLHSSEIDAELAGLTSEGITVAPYLLRRPVGKDWLASNLNVIEDGQQKATNYGWHTRTPGKYRAVTIPLGVYVLQPYANFHPWNHTDYSQTATFVRPDVSVRDLRTGETVETTLAALNGDATLSKLWNHDGPVRERMPSSSQLASIPWTTYGAAGLVTIAALAAAIKLARG